MTGGVRLSIATKRCDQSVRADNPRAPAHSDKENPRFTVCFFTKDHPGIQPTHALSSKLYEAVFENRTLDVWHAGEQSALEAVEIGNLKLFNKLSVPQGVSSLADELLNQIQDANSKKAKCLLQYAFCELYSRNIPKGHFRFLFDFLVEDDTAVQILVTNLNILESSRKKAFLSSSPQTM